MSSIRSPTTPSGWTAIIGGVSQTLFLFARVADGSEGSTVSISYGVSTGAAYVAERWTGASGNVEGARATGTGDAPNLAPSWGAQDTAWITGLQYTGGFSSPPTPPTNYGNQVNEFQAFNFSCSSAYRTLNASSENPGAWSGTTSSGAVSTIAIEPDAGGGGEESRTLSVAGAATVSFVSKALKESSLASSGLGAFSPQSKALKAATLSAAGVGAFNPIGRAAVIRTLSIAGAATVSFASKALKAAALSGAGQGAFSPQSKALKAAALSAAGQGAFSPQSKALKAATLTAAGQATANFIGTSDGGEEPEATGGLRVMVHPGILTSH